MTKRISRTLNFRLTPEMVLYFRKLLTAREVAFVFGLSTKTIRTLVYDGRLRCTRKYPMRVPVEDVKDYLKGEG